MKITLTKDQQLILAVLAGYDVGWELPDIAEVIWAYHSLQERNSQDLRTLVHFDHEAEFNRFLVKELVEDITPAVAQLESLGLLCKGTIRRGKEVLAQDVLLLTKDGGAVGKRLRKDRSVILRPPPHDRTIAFVAQAIGDEDTDRLYAEVFCPSCLSLGLQAYRVDLEEPSRTISDAILDKIEEAVCVIADLTYARQSVYFEAGFALGLGLPLLLTCRRDHRQHIRDDLRVHFDLAQFKISFWAEGKNGSFRWTRGMAPKERLSHLTKGIGGRGMPNKPDAGDA